MSLAPVQIAPIVLEGSEGESSGLSSVEGEIYRFQSQGSLFNDLASAGERLIVALPKRRGLKYMGARDLWVKEHMLISIQETQLVLDRVSYITRMGPLPWLKVSRLERSAPLTNCEQRSPDGTREPVELKVPNPQVIQRYDHRFTPRVICDQGIIAGEYQGESATSLLISDGDLVANFAIAETAPLLVKLFTHFSPPSVPISLDETGHGFKRPRSLREVMSSYPVYPLTLQLIALIAIVIWASMSRLIPPESPLSSASRERLRERLRESPKESLKESPRGPWVLIEEGGSLLSQGSSAHACQIYFTEAQTRVARRFKLAINVAPDELARQLDRIAEQRRLAPDLRVNHIAQLLASVEGSANHHAEDTRIKAATLIHHWTEEMIS